MNPIEGPRVERSEGGSDDKPRRGLRAWHLFLGAAIVGVVALTVQFIRAKSRSDFLFEVLASHGTVRGDASFFRDQPFIRLKCAFVKVHEVGLVEPDIDPMRLVLIPELKKLTFENQRITIKTIDAIGVLKLLNSLSFRECEFDVEAYPAMRKLTALEDLRFENVKVGSEIWDSLSGLAQLQSLTLRITGVSDESMAGVSKLRKITKLIIEGSPVEALPGLGTCGQLTELNLINTNVSDVGMIEIGKLHGLTRLSLYNAKVTDAGIRELTSHPSLRYLGLQGTRVTDECVPFLPKAASNRVIDFSGTALTDTGLKAILASSPPAGIQLQSTKVSPITVLKLQLGTPCLMVGFARPLEYYSTDFALSEADLEDFALAPMLTDVTIRNTTFTPRGLAALQKLQHLKFLALYDCRFVDDCFKQLPAFTSLPKLTLERCELTDDDLESVKGMKQLTWLRLKGNPISGKGLRHLKDLKNLRSLNLAQTKVESLEELEALPALEDINLGHTPITDNGLAWAVRHPKACSVTLTNTAITDAGVAPLTDLPLSGLSLSGTRITDATLDLIGRKNDLMFLTICRTAITDDGIRSVAKMQGLWSLGMDDTAITDDALDALDELPRTRSISVHGTAVSPEAINFYKTRWTIQGQRISDD